MKWNKSKIVWSRVVDLKKQAYEWVAVHLWGNMFKTKNKKTLIKEKKKKNNVL